MIYTLYVVFEAETKKKEFAVGNRRKTSKPPAMNKKMPSQSLEQKALNLMNTLEKAGKSVSRVIVEGRRIEVELLTREDSDEFDRIDMRYGKT